MKTPKAPAALETDFNATHAPESCEHAGQGGSYEIRDGKRVLVERTKPPAAAGESLTHNPRQKD